MIALFIISFIYTYNKTIALDHDYYYLNFMFFNTMFVSISLFKISKLMDNVLINNRMNNIIKYLSSLNFSIFLIHGLIIGGLSKIGIINIYYYDKLIFIVFNTLLVYILSCIFGVLFHNIFNMSRK